MSWPGRRLAGFAAAAASAAALNAQPVEFSASDATNAHTYAAALVKGHTPRHAGTIGARLAAEWIRESAASLGLDAKVDVFRAQSLDSVFDFANVIAEIRGSDGRDAKWIVFMSHFDTYRNAGPRFEGANDGASTTGLLLALAASIRRAGAPRRNVALLWTDGEEARYSYSPNDGFQGSKRAVAEFRRLGRDVLAAVNLDMLGDRDLRIELPANGTPSLNALVLKAARRAGLRDLVSPSRYEISDDFSAFLSAGWPATDLIDFSFGPGNRWWHLPDDTLDKISVDSLFKAGRVAAALFNLLDGR